MEDKAQQLSEETSQISRLPSKREYTPLELVDGIKREDIRICAAFYDTYSDKVNSLVWKLMGADDDHDDVVNAVFLNILVSVRKLKDPQALSKWVSSITINTVRKEIRKRRYRRLVTPVNVWEDYPDDEQTTGDVLGRVYQILDRMKADIRIVFILRYIAGNTYEEIAQIRGFSLATAKRQGKRGKQVFLKKARHDFVLSSFFEEREND